jgi:hypothetical protein
MHVIPNKSLGTKKIGRAMDVKLQEMMERMNELGRLLPNQVDIDTAIETGDTNKIAEIEIVLAEFFKAKAELDAFLDEHRQKRLAKN